MKTTTLGIDVGTNSLGWAVTVKSDDKISLVDAGCYIFQDGTSSNGEENQGIAIRTSARMSRRHYYKRRLLKVNTLKILSKYDFCPAISEEDLNLWLKKKIYPIQNTEFINWQKTDEKTDKNPYYDRALVLREKLDLTLQCNRYRVGRALYHLFQRRGFLSNAKNISAKSDGVIYESIDNISKSIKESGCQYLGEYFYHIYKSHPAGKIRGVHYHRTKHIEEEFNAICRTQALSEHYEDMVTELHDNIFKSRPKKYKGKVGHCTFEPSKKICAHSHPDYERFRMLCFINNIKIKYPSDSEFRPLNEAERREIIPLFYRKTSDIFKFEDIAKKIAGEGNYSNNTDGDPNLVKFNYRMATTVQGSPITASLRSIFGENWAEAIESRYKKRANKSLQNIVNDVWHVLYSFDSIEMLADWAKENLSLDENEVSNFVKIKTKIHKQYAALSLKAIRKINPFLEKGLRYDEAVFLANVPATLEQWDNRDKEQQEHILSDILSLLRDFKPYERCATKFSEIKGYIEDFEDAKLSKFDKLLYHPSKINIYPEVVSNDNGTIKLGSPRTTSFRNPAVFKALFRLRHLVNRLLKDGVIDKNTNINIELSRRLNSANMRNVIDRIQRENEYRNNQYRKEIKKYFKETIGKEIEPTENDILKYSLWEEQEHVCL